MAIVDLHRHLPERVRMWSPWWLRHVLTTERDNHGRTIAELVTAEDALYMERAEASRWHDTWTTSEATGRSNASARYESIVRHVEQLLKNEAHTLMAGKQYTTARMIVAQLAHAKGMAPRRPRRTT